MQFPRECGGLLSLVAAQAGPLRRFAPAPPEGELVPIATFALFAARESNCSRASLTHGLETG